MLPLRTANEAAEMLAAIANESRFTLYEYFITDKVGHAQDMEAARNRPAKPGPAHPGIAGPR